MRERAETAANFGRKPRHFSGLDTLASTLQKLAVKYSRINQIHSTKARQQTTSAKRHRENYLRKLQTAAETRMETEKEESEARERIVRKIEWRNKSAASVRLGLFVRKKMLVMEEHKKMLEVKKNLNNIERQNRQDRKNLLKKTEEQDQRLRMLKFQRRQLEVLRDKVDEEIRHNKIARVDNPYELFAKTAAALTKP